MKFTIRDIYQETEEATINYNKLMNLEKQVRLGKVSVSLNGVLKLMDDFIDVFTANLNDPDISTEQIYQFLRRANIEFSKKFELKCKEL